MTVGKAPAPRIPALDGLRAVSVAFVLLAHGGVSAGAPEALARVYPLANLGVRVFFVISGFLITHLLLEERAARGAIDLRAFYVRRAYRILPAAWVYMGVVTLACWDRLGAADLVTSYLYVVNYHERHPWELGHLWSLAVEEQFYLLWPFALALAFGRRRAILAATLVAAPLVRAALMLAYARRVPHVTMESLHYWFPSVADALATGCLLAVVRPALERRARFLAHPLMLLAPALTLALTLLVPRIPSRYTGLAYEVAVLPLVHLGIALTIEHCVRRRYAVLTSGPLAWAGVLSYSLYLWQQPFLVEAAALRGAAAWWQRYPQNFLLAGAVGCASYYLVERPVLRYRQRRGARSRRQERADALQLAG